MLGFTIGSLLGFIFGTGVSVYVFTLVLCRAFNMDSGGRLGAFFLGMSAGVIIGIVFAIGIGI